MLAVHFLVLPFFPQSLKKIAHKPGVLIGKKNPRDMLGDPVLPMILVIEFNSNSHCTRDSKEH